MKMWAFGYLFLFDIIHARTASLPENTLISGNAVQSSTYISNANNAIDGCDNCCTHTQTETNPWWRMDMMILHSIKEVVITNRIDCCPERINGTQIRIGNSLVNNGNNNPLCAEISTIPAGQSDSYSCGGLEGRYINLIIPGDSKNLTLCEVKVYSTDNVQLRGNAVQSSVFEYWNARGAIDGIKFAPGGASFCSHTNLERNPWWRLDMMENYYVSSVTITNRADCCAERINGVEIRIGYSLDNNGNSNPICAVISSIPAGGSQSFSCPESEGRYVNVVNPGYDKIVTLCEVEVYGHLHVQKQNFVKMKFVSSFAVPDSDKLLNQLQSTLEVRGITGVKISWTKPPQPEVKRDTEKGLCRRIQ